MSVRHSNSHVLRFIMAAVSILSPRPPPPPFEAAVGTTREHSTGRVGAAYYVRGIGSAHVRGVGSAHVGPFGPCHLSGLMW